MPTTSKVLFRGIAPTSNTTLYTTPSATVTVVTNIVIANPTTAAITATILLNDFEILGAVTLDANSSAFFDLKQVLNANQTIKGFASSASADFHISGVEIN